MLITKKITEEMSKMKQWIIAYHRKMVKRYMNNCIIHMVHVTHRQLDQFR